MEWYIKPILIKGWENCHKEKASKKFKKRLANLMAGK